MQVTRSAAIQMFKELGYKTCEKWEVDRLERKLNKLPEFVDGTPDVPDSIKNDPNHLCNVICNMVKNKENIELVLEEGEKEMKTKEKDKKKRGKVLSVAEYEGREEPKGKKNSAKGKERIVSKKKDKGTEPGEKKEKAGTDALGFRIGSQAAKINEILLNAKKPVDRNTLAEKTGLPGRRILQHVRWLELRKQAKDTDDGVVLTK